MAKEVLKFITSNSAKILEARMVLAPIKILAVKIGLDEIQEVDPKKIIEHKMRQALKRHKGPLIVDDSSLFLACFNYKLPGPLIKWFNIHAGMNGMAGLVKKMGNNKARAETFIGYAENARKILFFKGVLEGKIVPPRGSYGFGYDPIFQPNGQGRTLSEMKQRANFYYSPRGLALAKLKKYLLSSAEQ